MFNILWNCPTLNILFLKNFLPSGFNVHWWFLPEQVFPMMVQNYSSCHFNLRAWSWLGWAWASPDACGTPDISQQDPRLCWVLYRNPWASRQLQAKRPRQVKLLARCRVPPGTSVKLSLWRPQFLPSTHSVAMAQTLQALSAPKPGPFLRLSFGGWALAPDPHPHQEKSYSLFCFPQTFRFTCCCCCC